MRREFFRVHAGHLGDVIVSTNLLYNMSLQGKFVSVVEYERSFVHEQLFKIFDYEGFVVNRVRGIKGMKSMPYCHIVKSTSRLWCAKSHISGTACLTLKSFTLPKNRVQPKFSVSPYQVCQFDSRSAFDLKRSYGRMEVDAAVRRFNMGNAHYIGGKDTATYTAGLPTHYADLLSQASFVSGSQSFFGVDSGMSHLAGSLGIPGDVCIQTQDEGFVSCVVKMYRFMYPKMRLHRRICFR